MARMTIKRVKDAQIKKCIMHKVADFRGGMGVAMPKLAAGTVVPEGTPVVRDENGLAKVVLGGVVSSTASSGASEIVLKAGAIVGVGASLYTVASASAEPTLVGTVAGVVDNGSTVTVTLAGKTSGQITAETAVYTESPKGVIGVTGTSFVAAANSNEQVDVVLIGVVYKSAAPSALLALSKAGRLPATIVIA